MLFRITKNCEGQNRSRKCSPVLVTTAETHENRFDKAVLEKIHGMRLSIVKQIPIEGGFLATATSSI